MANAEENMTKLVNMISDIQTSLANQEQQRLNSDIKIDNLALKIDNFNNRVENIEKKLEANDKKNLLFYDELDQVKGELNTLKQKEIEHNLIIKNVTERENETNVQLQSIVQQIIATLGITDVGVLRRETRIHV